jgi:hypothetical protein
MFAEIATNVLYNFDAGLLTSFVSVLTALSIGLAAVVTTAPKIKKVRKPTHRSMTLKQWYAVADAPIQRNTAKHAAKIKTRKNLSKLKPSHMTVIMAVLPDNSTYKVDGHTRTYMWANGLTDQVPDNLDVIVHQADDIEDVLDLYNSYDGDGQVKSAPDQLYSAFKQFDIPITSKFFQNAAGIVSALKEAYREICRAYDIEDNGDPRYVSVATTVEFFKNQLVALDEQQPKTSLKGPNFKGPVTTSFLLAHYKYSEMNIHVADVISFFHHYNNDLGVKNGKNYDPIYSVTKTMSGKGAGEQLRMTRTAEILGAVERWLQPNGREARYTKQSEVELANYLVEKNARKTSRAQIARLDRNKKGLTR